MFTLGRLTFEKVDVSNLQKNKCYMSLSRDMLWNNWNESYWIVGKYQFTDNDKIILGPARQFVFKKNTISKQYSFEMMPSTGDFYKFSTNLEFYALVASKKKIQENMERRALQSILQTIVNDPTFIW
jgi:hypothetical protein